MKASASAFRSRRLAALAGALVVVLAVGGSARAAGIGLVDGLWVMKKADEVYEGDDVQEDMRLTLDKTGDRAGDPKILDVRWLKKDFGKEKGLIIHFIRPRYVAGVTLSMTIKPYMDDDRWLYFPDANLIRRVAAADRYSNFMGTDFTYFDLSEREPDEESHTLLRIEEFEGVPCYVVETVPKNPLDYAAYARKLTWVDKDRFLKLRIQYFNREGKLRKQYDPDKWQQIDGVWTPTLLVMEDVLGFHKTVIERTNIRYNTGLAKEYFLPQNVDCVQYRDGKFSLIPFEQRPTRVWEQKRKAQK